MLCLITNQLLYHLSYAGQGHLIWKVNGMRRKIKQKMDEIENTCFLLSNRAKMIQQMQVFEILNDPMETFYEQVSEAPSDIRGHAAGCINH